MCECAVLLPLKECERRKEKSTGNSSRKILQCKEVHQHYPFAPTGAFRIALRVMWSLFISPFYYYIEREIVFAIQN